MVKPVDSYKIGDVITFASKTQNKIPITHRIVEMRVDTGNPVYITKGDANEEADTREIKQSEIIGRVLIDVPYLGYAVATAQTPWGFAILIIIPASLIIFDESKKIWKQIAGLHKQKQNGDAKA